MLGSPGEFRIRFLGALALQPSCLPVYLLVDQGLAATGRLFGLEGVRPGSGCDWAPLRSDGVLHPAAVR